MADDYRCGYVTIIGRPNVGKSTLINRILGQKLSITSNKPQTTRWQLLGIKTGVGHQVIYVDTPGLQFKYRDSMNRHMIREIRNSLVHVDVLLFMIEALVWKEMDAAVVEMLADIQAPVILLINKTDKIRDKDSLLPFIDQVARHGKFSAIVPVSARKGDNISNLEKTIHALLPVAAMEFPEQQLTDRSERFFAAEFIREKLTRQLGEELPYRIAVTIDEFKPRENILHVYATIWVASDSQKKIIVGRNGSVLRLIGEQARKDMQVMFENQVYLQTWVKVRKNWPEDTKALKQFGYDQ